MGKKENLQKILFLLLVSILIGYGITVYSLVAEDGSKLSVLGAMAFIGLFTILDLIAVALLLFLYGKDKKKYEEKVKQLLHDVNLRNQEETEKKISNAKIDFLTKVSHGIRVPLNNIMGFNDLILAKKNLENEIFENASKIHDSGATLVGFVNDILDFSKIKHGQFELVPVDYEISSLINSVVSSNATVAESKLIKFNLNIDENLPNHLIGDELRVKQIFDNILSNAFKYTKRGTVEWSIGFERNNSDIWLISKVKDSGIGMKKEDIDNFYSKYDQFNTNVDGLGLGLSITKEIVGMMNGTVTVESEYGKGTIFTVKIKQQLRNETPISEKTVNKLKNFGTQASKEERNIKPVYNQMPYAHVLIVDDMPLNLEVAQGLMRPYGMLTETAPSGKIAIAKIMNQSTKYSAIFMDHMMPGMDGVEAVRRIRELNSDYAKKIPIIALTANALVGSEKMFLENGFSDFLSKPIDIMRLDAVLKKWVRDESKEK